MCQGDTDCPGGRVCHQAECVPLSKLDCDQSGDRQPVIVSDQSIVAFGDLDGTSAERTLTIQNDGVCSLKIERVSLEAEPSRFACATCAQTQFPITVLPSREADLQLLALPGPPGTIADRLIIESNDRERSPLVVELEAESRGIPMAAVDPTEVDFGFVVPGTSLFRVVQVLNRGTGAARLGVESIALEPADSPAFTIETDDTLPLLLENTAVDQTARFFVRVTYHPAVAADHEASLVIRTALGDPLRVPLFGAGDPPDIDTAPAAIDFGQLLVGDAASRSVTVQNVGVNPLVGAYTLMSGASGDLTIPSPLPAIRPGGLAELVLVYAPTLATTVNDTLVISSNDPDESPIQIPITASAIASGRDVVAVELNFDNDSDTALDVDLRNVDLIMESPLGLICSEAVPAPSWGSYGTPRWSAAGRKRNPERIVLPDAMEDGRYPVLLSYVEDCSSLPTALTALLLGIGSEALVDYLSDGEVPLDPDEVAAAVETACVNRRSANARLTVTINGAPVATPPFSLEAKGDFVTALTLVRTAGRFTVE